MVLTSSDESLEGDVGDAVDVMEAPTIGPFGFRFSGGVKADAFGDHAGTLRWMHSGASEEVRDAVRRARWAHC